MFVVAMTTSGVPSVSAWAASIMSADGIIAGGRLTLLASLRPQLSRPAHGDCRDRQVFRGAGQGVKAGDGGPPMYPQQLPTQFVVYDLGDENASPC